jgi:hypothetical protein
MNEFIERYKTLSDLELLKIIDLADDYQPSAVIAAKTEFENRNLKKEEIEFILQQLNKEKAITKEKVELRKKQANDIKKRIADIFDYFNPIQKEIPKPDKIIKFLFLGYLVFFFYKFYKEFRFLIWMFTDSRADWDLSTFFYFFPLIILPIAIILFWKRKRIGWVLLSIFNSYSVIGALCIFITEVGRERTPGLEVLDNLFQTPPPIYYLIGSIIWGAILYTLLKKEIRKKYNIDQTRLFISIGIGGLLTYFSYSIL